MPPKKLNPAALEKFLEESEAKKDVDFDSIDGQLLKEAEEVIEKEDIIFNTFAERKTVKQLTNFEEAEVIGLYHLNIPNSNKHKRRGPLPKYTLLDSIFLLLCFYKSGLDYPTLSAMLGVQPSTLQTNHCPCPPNFTGNFNRKVVGKQKTSNPIG